MVTIEVVVIKMLLMECLCGFCLIYELLTVGQMDTTSIDVLESKSAMI